MSIRKTDNQRGYICNSKDSVITKATKEASNIINFFSANDLVNNADKAALLYNSKGKGEEITVENVGGVRLKSKKSDKLLGLHINSNFEWNTHVDKLLITLKQRLGMLKRISTKIPRHKLKIFAESIFNSKIRYGIAVYGIHTSIYPRSLKKLPKHLFSVPKYGLKLELQQIKFKVKLKHFGQGL